MLMAILNMSSEADRKASEALNVGREPRQQRDTQDFWRLKHAELEGLLRSSEE